MAASLPGGRAAPESLRVETRSVLGAADVSRALTRIAFEILEANHGADDLVLLGIPTRGVPLAARIGSRILAGGHPTAADAVDPRLAELVGTLDVTDFRDDLALRPDAGSSQRMRTRIPGGSVDDRTVVLVDDVLFSGRTARAALDALGRHGRPRAVRLAVLADRGHRELPIRADHVGKNLPTSLDETVRVRLAETDGADAVVIERRHA